MTIDKEDERVLKMIKVGKMRFKVIRIVGHILIFIAVAITLYNGVKDLI